MGRAAGRQAMSGRLIVVGLGPGDPRYLTPDAEEALAAAEAIYGYGPYLDRVPVRAGQTRHASNNREERARAANALRHAAQGARVAVVSGGDPGVFAMAAAICEEIEAGPDSWRALDVTIIPGITAMLAVAARIGAPLGHDFCAISLSDNLKPWPLIEQRLDAAAGAGFVIALYNPVSRARPWQFHNAIERLRRHLPPTTPVIFGRAVGREDEQINVVTLDAADAANADMATLVIVGSRDTRGRGGQRMIEPGDRVFDCLDRGSIGRGWPAQHDDVDAERARRGDLAVGRGAAAVLGNHHVDTMLGHQRTVVGFTKRAAAGDVADMRQRQRRIDRIDAADQIIVLRCIAERLKLVAAERDKDAARRLTDRPHRLADVVHLDPPITCDRDPGRASQRDQWHAASPRSFDGIRRNHAG